MQVEEERSDGVEQSVTLVNWCTTRLTVPERERGYKKVWLEVQLVSCQTLNLFELHLYKM